MSFLLGAYPLGIVGILFVGVYILYDINTDDITHVTIDESGVALNNDLYGFGNIREFGIIRINQWPTILRLIIKKQMVNSLDLFIDPEIDTETLRTYLTQYIPDNAQIRFSVIDRILLGLRL